MALPQLKTLTYELNLPSNGKAIKYRPFLVNEQKNLMIAQESEDEKMMETAFAQIIGDCVLDDIDPYKMPMFDIEYVFLQIRAKSVGSEVELSVYCPDDGETMTQVKVQLEDIAVQTNVEHKTEYNLTDDIKINFRYPRLNDVQDLPADASDFERMTKLVHHCIDTVETPDEVINRVDMSEEEIDEFIDSFNGPQLESAIEFFDTMPKVRHLVEVTNPVTDVKGEILLEGIESFLE